MTVNVIEYRGLDVSGMDILHALKDGNADVVAQGEAKQIGSALKMVTKCANASPSIRGLRRDAGEAFRLERLLG